jgi:redox-sensitive bicupin YhaK (pirin superfamily)
MVGPFIFFDQMGPARLELGEGIDVRPHPHINLATVTFLFEGAMDHRDSIGTFQRIEPGAVNLMTAGSGITHSERSPADERALYLLNGDASVDGAPLGVQHLVILAPGTRPVLRSSSGGRLVLCGGAPMDGERIVWWNFVSSSRERINEAKRAWKAGEFALPPEDDGEFIPLPEIPMTVSYP